MLTSFPADSGVDAIENLEDVFAEVSLQRQFRQRSRLRKFSGRATESGDEPDREVGDDLVVGVEEVRGLVQK